MIDFYAWATPNVFKVSIMFAELSLEPNVIPVNIGRGQQFDPGFLAVSPNNKVPAIVDSDGPDGQPLALFESGAILIYLADKYGAFLPAQGGARYRTLQWLMFQMGGVGPMLGQVHHFRGDYAPEPIPYAIERYTKEAGRLYGVLDRQLAKQEYLADAYSIADIAVLPWVRLHKRQGQNIDSFPNLKRWIDQLSMRPAVVKGLGLLRDEAKKASLDQRAKEALFGQQQYSGTR